MASLVGVFIHSRSDSIYLSGGGAGLCLVLAKSLDTRDASLVVRALNFEGCVCKALENSSPLANSEFLVANSKSAAKRARQNDKRNIRNTAVRSVLKSAVRSFNEAVASGSVDEAAKTLANATRVIRKASSKGVLHASTASRRVSRLVLAFNKLK